jgi:EAL domain-containing protein (putative c-di-GMP-specific phosphodiesterase class I)
MYSNIGDIFTIIVCVVLFFVLHMTYVQKNKRLMFIKLALCNLIYASAFNMIFNHYIEKLPIASHKDIMITYLTHNIVQISLIIELGLFIFYIYDLVNYHNKISNAFIIVLTAVFSILELTSIKTHVGFYINDAQAYQYGITNIFLVWYIIFLSIFTITIISKNRVIINKIYFTVGITFFISILIMFFQYIKNIETFTNFTFLLPIMVIIFIFHSNSYNTNFGALDRTALANSINDLKKKNKSFAFVYIKIPNFNEIATDNKTTQDYKQFTKYMQYRNYLFRYNDDTFVMTFDNDFDYELMEKLFNDLHSKYQMSHNVIIILNNTICNTLVDYIDLCEDIEKQANSSFYILNNDDLINFSKILKIKKELEDIANQKNFNDERVLVYCQPILDTKLNKFTTAESLMRLKLDGLGIIYPDVFIPLAEKNNNIHILTCIILNKVCKFIEKNPEITRISVNFSMYEITNPKFYHDIYNIISKYHFDLNKLGFEITETVEAKDFDIINDTLQRFRNLGIKIYLDDFGTGYSNIEHITKIPIDIIKFDRSLVISSGQSEKSKYIVSNMSDIFYNTNYNILYEGIEDNNDEYRCMGMNAEYLQGYKYSKPIPIEELSKFINQQP